MIKHKLSICQTYEAGVNHLKFLQDQALKGTPMPDMKVLYCRNQPSNTNLFGRILLFYPHKREAVRTPNMVINRGFWVLSFEEGNNQDVQD